MSPPFSLTLTRAPCAVYATEIHYAHISHSHEKSFYFSPAFFPFATFVFSFALFYTHTHIQIIYYYYYHYPSCVLASIVRCEQRIFIIIPKFKFTRSWTQNIYCTFGGGGYGVRMPTNATLSSMLAQKKWKVRNHLEEEGALARSLVCFLIAVGDDVVDVDDADDARTDPLPVSVGSCLFFIYFRCLTWLQIVIGYMCRAHMEIRALKKLGEII